MFNSELTRKLSVEWKHIYRTLLSMDILQRGLISVKKFNKACLSHNVALTREELRRLISLTNVDTFVGPEEDPMNAKIDYMQVSKNLGLHKKSFKLMTINSGLTG